jgi:MFS family permease
MTHALELAFAALLARIAADFDASLATMGAVATAGTFTFGATAIPSGFLSDRLGPRAVIAGCLAAAGLAAFAVAAAPNLWTLTIVLSVLGAAIGFYHPAGTSLVSTVATRRGMAFAIHGIAGNLGVALAPALSVGIAMLVNWRLAYAVLGVMALVSAAIVWRIAPPRDEARAAAELAATRPKSKTSRTSPPEPRRWLSQPMVLIYAVAIGMGFIYRGALTFMQTHIEDHLGFDILGASPEDVAGAVTTTVLLFSVFGQVIGGGLSDRIPVERSLVPITAVAFPALALAAMSSGVALLGALVVFVISNFAQQPIINGLITDYAPRGAAGRAFGVSFFLTFGVGSIAGVFAGWAADAAGTDAAFLLLAGVGAALAATAVVISLGADRRRARDPGASHATSPVSEAAEIS